jgi:hypothetical protein
MIHLCVSIPAVNPSCSTESADRHRFYASFLRDFAIHLVSVVVI